MRDRVTAAVARAEQAILELAASVTAFNALLWEAQQAGFDRGGVHGVEDINITFGGGQFETEIANRMVTAGLGRFLEHVVQLGPNVATSMRPIVNLVEVWQARVDRGGLSTRREKPTSKAEQSGLTPAIDRDPVFQRNPKTRDMHALSQIAEAPPAGTAGIPLPRRQDT